MPSGRLSGYDPKKHPAEYIELCSKGKTRAMICAEWRICDDTLRSWAKKDPAFLGSIKAGDRLRQAWFERLFLNIGLGREMEGVNRKNVNMTALIWMTKNSIGWREKVEQSDHFEEDIDGVEFVD